MKFHNNSFGRRGTKAIFLSAATLAAAIQLTSCADSSELPALPPLYEETTDSQTSVTVKPSPGPSQTESVSPPSTEAPDAVAPEYSEQTVTVTENELAFDIHYIYSENLYDDVNIVLKEGKHGFTISTYRVRYENGKEVSRELLSKEVTEPEAQTVLVGTKPSVSERTETVREHTVSFATRYEYDATLEAGKTVVKSQGTDGYTESVYRITYHKGEEVSRELVSSVTHAPEDRVITVGTKEVFYMPFLDAAHGGHNYPVTQDFSSSHRGIDFGVWYGDPITAIKGGKVIAAYDEGYFSKDNILWTYGTYVVVEHEDGMRSYYAHLKSRTVSVGDTVSGGQIIGYSGNTGRTNPEPTASKPYAGTHLHFEIRVKKNGVYVTTDPKAYLPYWN